MSSIDEDIREIKEHLHRVDLTLERINGELGDLRGRYDVAQLIVKWAVFPLIVVLGALVGIKLAWPAL